MATDKSRQTNWPQLSKFVTEHHDTYAAIDPRKADLSGKSVVITGASKGVGRATAISFAKAGASQIALAARSSLVEVVKAVKEGAAAAGRPEPTVLALDVDVTSEESVRAAAEKMGKAFGGRLDVLVANAGYLEKWVPILESETAEWWKSWEVNLHGTYLTCRYFLPLVLASGSGGTVLVLSSAGANNLGIGASAYQMSKFANCRFVEFLDLEHHDKGVIAISIHPGGVKTELSLNMPRERHALLIDEPELPADMMVWLAKEKREWLAGRFVSCCWDVEELEKKKDQIMEGNLLKFRMLC